MEFAATWCYFHFYKASFSLCIFLSRSCHHGLVVPWALQCSDQCSGRRFVGHFESFLRQLIKGDAQDAGVASCLAVGPSTVPCCRNVWLPTSSNMETHWAYWWVGLWVNEHCRTWQGEERVELGLSAAQWKRGTFSYLLSSELQEHPNIKAKDSG